MGGRYKPPRGQPRKFRSGEHLIKCLSEFCEAIVEHGYNKLPSRSNFCRWYADQCKQSISTRTVWLSMTQYYPGIKDDAMELISDVLVQGAALGKWNSTMVIFALKNWCHWSEKKDTAVGADVIGAGGTSESKQITFTFEVIDKVEGKNEQS